jgi:predicted ATPase
MPPRRKSILARPPRGQDGPQRAITRIAVTDLFGRYSYDVPVDRPALDPQLSILYGDNGAGKTTILTLVHHMISCANGRGHKTRIAQIPLRTCIVEFTAGMRLTIARPEPTIGSYEMALSHNGSLIAEVFYRAENGSIPRQGEFADAQDRFTSTVEEHLGLSSYMLTDERTLESDAFAKDDDEDDSSTWLAGANEMRLLAERWSRQQSNRSSQLGLALDRARQWVTSQALSDSNTGTASANTIYEQVVHQLSAELSTEELPLVATTETDFAVAITDLARRNADQARFGLAPQLDVRELLKGLRDAPPDRRPWIIRLLGPYADSIRARLDATEDLYRLLKALTENLNSFLLDKQVTFDIRRGLIVRTESGNILNPESLSSGEKQLLMLLCNLIISRQQSSIFLVDEPELSLNVKWQRKLVPSLLSCTVGSHIQLLLATHSIELLSGYRDRVVQLPFGSD